MDESTLREGAGVSRRAFLRGGAAVLAAGGAVGVLPSLASAEALQPGKPKKGGTLSEGWISDVKYLSSVLVGDTYSSLIAGLCNDGLLAVDGKGNMQPMIATAVPTGGSDGKTYTFKLRTDVKWTDGTPLTSDDVLFTYNLMFAPEYAAVASPRRGALTENVESLSAPDPQTFVIKTKEVYAPLLVTHGTYGIMPKHVLGKISAVDMNTMSYNSNPTPSNGMFKFVSWTQGSQVVLERNEGYYRGAPLLDRYVYKVLPSSDTIGDQLKTGEIQVGPTLDPSQVASLQTVQGLKIKNFVVPDFSYIALQLDPTKPAGKILQDVNVRHALTYAINRPGIVKSVLYGFGTVATSVEPPTSFAYDPHTKPQYSYNPKKANQLLDKAGWVKHSDGIRRKNGVKLAFNMIGTAASLTTTDTMQVLEQNWKAIGCQLTTTEIQFPQLLTALEDTRDFDMILLGFNFSNDPDQSSLFASSATAVGGFNASDFKNPKVDKLLEQGGQTLNKNKRKQIYSQYQNLMAELQPVIILYFEKNSAGILSKVKGMDLNTFQVFTRPWMNKVWMENGGGS